MDSKGEVLLTIMASLAQQESQSLSQNVKMGIQYRYQQGKVQINHNRFLGYTKDADGNLIIDPEQAEIVKRIYREYLEGKSMDKVAAEFVCTVFIFDAGCCFLLYVVQDFLNAHHTLLRYAQPFFQRLFFHRYQIRD